MDNTAYFNPTGTINLPRSYLRTRSTLSLDDDLPLAEDEELDVVEVDASPVILTILCLTLHAMADITLHAQRY